MNDRTRFKSQKKQLDEEWQTLHAKIGVLENFIAGSVVREERRKSLRAQNVLPPPEQARRSHSRQRMSRWQERHYHHQRERHGLMFLLLFVAVCATAWWLINHVAP
ncbi:MAG: hypothetical protein KDM91_15600 [Verrucomicrobiae bacterium]|nr:hypothetical protein [Verrucomicrobiae bacterium]MCP5539698.1 hypothetical protein [Akkermansiaceae bacterium]